MTYFGQLLLKAVRPKTRVPATTGTVVVYRTVKLEEKMKEQRGFSLNKTGWNPMPGTLVSPDPFGWGMPNEE